MSLPISRYKNIIASVPDHVTGLVLTVTLKFNTGRLLVTVVGGSVVVGEANVVVVISVLLLSISELIFSIIFTYSNKKGKDLPIKCTKSVENSTVKAHTVIITAKNFTKSFIFLSPMIYILILYVHGRSRTVRRGHGPTIIFHSNCSDAVLEYILISHKRM